MAGDGIDVTKGVAAAGRPYAAVNHADDPIPAQTNPALDGLFGSIRNSQRN
jgi:hypothetical protein